MLEDPFENENIPYEHLQYAPPGLIERFPSLKKLSESRMAVHAQPDPECKEPECPKEPEDKVTALGRPRTFANADLNPVERPLPASASVSAAAEQYASQRQPDDILLNAGDYFNNIKNGKIYINKAVLAGRKVLPPRIYLLNEKGEEVENKKEGAYLESVAFEKAMADLKSLAKELGFDFFKMLT